MNRLRKFWTDLFFPRTCVSCKTLLDWYEPTRKHAVFCDTCLQKWENERLETCGVCAKRIFECACLTEAMERAKCTSFRKLIYYRHGTADAVQNRLIFHIKHHCIAETPRFLAAELLPAVKNILETSGAETSDVYITYIPRSKHALAKYGTDQAELLAKALSKIVDLEVRRLILRNRRQNKQQKNLSPAERIQNAKASFRLAETVPLKGKTVLLVDDIVTTGASMAACTKLLRRAGAKEVYCLAIASDDANKDRVR